MSLPKIAWILLTYNRRDCVLRALRHNWEVAGYEPHEFVHVDNGSKEPVAKYVRKELRKHGSTEFIQCCNSINYGVSRGYNAALALCRADWIVLTGCDWYMPFNWLATMVEYVRRIPQTGIAWMRPKNGHFLPLAAPEMVNNLPIQRAVTMGPGRIIRRESLKTVGFWREDFGMYGWEDVDHGERMQHHGAAVGWLSYIIPHRHPVDADTDKEKKKYKDYWDWKAKQTRAVNLKYVEELRAKNLPYYFP